MGGLSTSSSTAVDGLANLAAVVIAVVLLLALGFCLIEIWRNQR